MRYPVDRTTYCKTVGRTRVKNIAEIFRSLDGFDVTIKESEAHDVDLWVSNGDGLVLVVEVLNWKRNAYLSFKRAMAIVHNLTSSSYCDLNKLLVFSFWENIRNQMEFFDGLDIEGSASDMRPNDEMTRKIVRRKLMAYLTEKGLI